jgi:hypothetical protein
VANGGDPEQPIRRLYRHSTPATASAVEVPSKYDMPNNTRARKDTKQGGNVPTEQPTTALVVAAPSSIVSTGARVTHLAASLSASSQSPLPPDTTSEALMTQTGLGKIK